MKKAQKKQQGAFHKNLETMTYRQIMSMTILDSECKIRFLHDHKDSKMYVAFDGRTNQTYWSKSYQKAEARYNHLVADCKNNSTTPNN